MKIKYIIIYTLVLALVMSAGGCSLARPDAGEESAAQAADRLIGCFITTEYIDLFDFESYFEDNVSELVNGGEISSQSAMEYQGRIYAELVEEFYTDSKGETHSTWTYKFTGLEGVAYYAPLVEDSEGEYITFETGEGLQKVNNKVNSTDAGYGVELSAALYVPIDTVNVAENEFCYYMNPVYQTSDGSVYLMAGSGYWTNLGDTPGVEMSSKLNEAYSYTVNDVTTEIVNSVEIECIAVFVPVSVTLIRMAKDGVVLGVDSFLPSELPEQYEAGVGCEYIIMETHAFDGQGNDVIERRTIAPGTDDCNIFVLVPGDNGFMSYVTAEVLWNE